MNISAFELTLIFAEDTRLKTYVGAVSEALGEEITGEISQPVIVRRGKEKFAARWDYAKCSMLKEDVDNSNECINEFIETIETINGVAPIGKLSSRNIRVDWVLPVNDKYNFKKLEVEYRRIFIKQTSLSNKAYDSSVLLDIKCDQGILHHQSGPMGIAQLQDGWRSFKTKDGYPNLFLFIDSVINDEQLIEYSKLDMKKFVKNSFQLCKSHAENFEKIVGGVL